MATDLLFSDPASFPAAAVDCAADRLDAAEGRLAELAARAGAVQAVTDWYSPAGRAFGDRVDALRRRIVALQAGVDDVRDGVRRMRAELAIRAGS